MVSSGWGQCDPANAKNRRRRPSILVEEGDTRILIDTSPDLREQLLDAKIRTLTAVLYTHSHADHLHGLDDLREVNRAMHGPLPAYATQTTFKDIRERFGYALEGIDLVRSKGAVFRPWLVPHELDGPFEIGPLRIVPLDQDHGVMRSTGFRFGERFAYSTDLVDMPEESFQGLMGLDTWIVSCLTTIPHHTHAHLARVLEWIERLKPRRVVITHMGPTFDYEGIRALLPGHVEPGFDGMVIEV